MILKARAEEHICKLMGKLKFPEDLSIGRRGFANDVPSMFGLQPDPPKSPYHQDLLPLLTFRDHTYLGTCVLHQGQRHP